MKGGGVASATHMRVTFCPGREVMEGGGGSMTRGGTVCVCVCVCVGVETLM